MNRKRTEPNALVDWVLGRKKKTEKKDDQPKKKKVKGNPDRVDLIRRCHARRLREKQQIAEEAEKILEDRRDPDTKTI